VITAEEFVSNTKMWF